MRGFLVSVLVLMTAFQPVAFAANTRASSMLADEVKNLRISLDSGVGKPADALDRFTDALIAKGVTQADIDAFARTQMSVREYAAFRKQLDFSLHGIDPVTLTPKELGEIFTDALMSSHSQGLSWSSCATAWTGAAILAVSVVAGVIAIIKARSQTTIDHPAQQYPGDEETRASYERQRDGKRSFWESWRQSSRTNADRGANDARNWQTAYPTLITQNQNEIASNNLKIADNQRQIDNLTRLALLSSEEERKQYLEQIKTLMDENETYRDRNLTNTNYIATLNSRMDRFRRDPGAIDQVIAEIYQNRDNNIAYADRREIEDIAQLNQWEQDAIKRNQEMFRLTHPGMDGWIETIPNERDRELARGLVTGAVLGGAAGAFMLFLGIDDGGC